MLASQNNNEVKEKIKNGGSSRMEDGEVGLVGFQQHNLSYFGMK